MLWSCEDITVDRELADKQRRTNKKNHPSRNSKTSLKSLENNVQADGSSQQPASPCKRTALVEHHVDAETSSDDAKGRVSITGYGVSWREPAINSGFQCNWGSYPHMTFWNSLSLSSRTCFGILVLILSKDGSVIWDEKRRTGLISK